MADSEPMSRPIAASSGMARSLLVALLLGGAAALLFAPTARYDFINLDDDDYVRNNPIVNGGLTGPATRQAWSRPYGGLWSPLLWMSYMADVTLLGFSARSFHLTNILLHSLNVMLLFLLLRRLTRQTGRSLWVAAMFAAHPLVVEPVAWIASRKDLLSAFFSILTLHGYATYVRRPGWRNYLLTAVSMALALLSKPMAVTLPFVLLLLDFWPLSRSRSPERPSAVPWARLAMEKIPLLILAVVFCGIAYWAQQEAGAINSLRSGPLTQRLLQIPDAYLTYLGKTMWPARLCVLYPLQPDIRWSRFILGLAVLTALSVIAFRMRGQAPAVLTGWLWFLGVLVPVIGVVRFGVTPIADRFIYLPSIGLFMSVAWISERLTGREAQTRWLLAGLGAMLVVACGAVTRLNLPRWRDSMTLMKDAVRKGPHVTACNNLGSALVQLGKNDEAVQCFRQAIRLYPDSSLAHFNLGTTLATLGRYAEAIPHYREAARLQRDYPETYNNLGIALCSLGRHAESLPEYRKALELRPQYADAHYNLAITLSLLGRHREALQHYEALAQLRPDDARTQYLLAGCLELLGRAEEAVAHYQQAIGRRDDYPEGHLGLANVLASLGRQADAVPHYQKVIRLRPQDVAAHNNLGMAQGVLGRHEEAVASFEQAIRLRPDDPDACNNIAWLRATCPKEAFRNGAEAVRMAEQACRLTEHRNPDMIDTLAAAYAEAGRFQEAIETASKAIRLFHEKHQGESAAKAETRLSAYRNHKPWRE